MPVEAGCEDAVFLPSGLGFFLPPLGRGLRRREYELFAGSSHPPVVVPAVLLEEIALIREATSVAGGLARAAHLLPQLRQSGIDYQPRIVAKKA